MRISTIVGARPQFVKAAALSAAFRKLGNVEEEIIHTGQHYDNNLSDLFFEELGLQEPTYNLAIGSASHGAQTARMLEGIEQVLLQTTPDCVIVYGDTNSTLAGALAAVKLHLPLAHVEAGLRSYNRAIPEEINRILTDHSSDFLFAPTITAADNLRREGIPDRRVHFVGDVMYDMALHCASKAETRSTIMSRLGLQKQKYVLATIHRPSNTDDAAPLRTIMHALMRLGRELPVVLPLHPRTRKSLEREHMLEELSQNMIVMDPVGYLDMVILEKNARLIATDSGGIQKEAFFYRVPCVTLREETEWPELVELGWNRLAPPKNVASVLSVLRKGLEASPGQNASLYGDGRSAGRIAELLLEHVQEGKQMGTEHDVFSSKA